MTAAVAVTAVLIALMIVPGGGLSAAAQTPAKTPAGIAGDAAAALEYAACMDLARNNPKQAHETALAWRQRGGGNAAGHCAAVALIGLGEYARAAGKIEALVRAMADGTNDGNAALRARLLGQAGNVWTIAGESGRAYAAQTEALGLNPDDPNVLIDRGITLTSTKKFWAALDDLNRALEIAPDRVDALVFRAIAWRHLDSLDLADDDIRRALALAPDNPDALLESGTIRRRKGDNDGARRAWLRVLKRAPDSSPADAARRSIEQMDRKKPR
jgi:tetratricopeptide (TPR) repeat protein